MRALDAAILWAKRRLATTPGILGWVGLALHVNSPGNRKPMISRAIVFTVASPPPRPSLLTPGCVTYEDLLRLWDFGFLFTKSTRDQVLSLGRDENLQAELFPLASVVITDNLKLSKLSPSNLGRPSWHGYQLRL